jgi:predicted nucleic acid-binding protein
VIAVDTNILLDVLVRGAEHEDVSRKALLAARKAGSLVTSEIVYAEIAAQLGGEAKTIDAFYRDAGLELAPSTRDVLAHAGAAWRAYRQRGGKRTRMAADFLIGAHALANGGALLTRDADFYRTNFAKLRVIDPSEGGDII